MITHSKFQIPNCIGHRWITLGRALAAIVPGALLALLVVAGFSEYSRMRGL